MLKFVHIVIIVFFVSALNADLIQQNQHRLKENVISRIPVSNEVNTRNEEELIEYIQSVINTYMVPGVSASIVKNNNIVWNGNFGYANIDDDILVDSSTMFILSSVSKTITATALMQLWENGLFDLDDDIDEYLPFTVNHPDFPFLPITFKMLLTHTSGIDDNWNVMTYYDGDSDLELEYYLEQYLTPGGDFYGNNSSYTNSQPGTDYRYSNNGAALIGLLVEQISNQPFSEYCHDYIFEPLGMNNAFWFLADIENLNQVALPYNFSGGSGDNCYDIGCGVYASNNPCFCDDACIYYNDCCSDYEDVCGEDGTGSGSVTFTPYNHYGYSDWPSGQLRTSSIDLAKFMAAILNGGEYNGNRILNENTIEVMKTIFYPLVSSSQGLIWYYKNSQSRTLFGHNGGDLGSLTEMFISFDENIGVVVLSNSSNYNAVINIENALFSFAEENEFFDSGDINFDSQVNIFDIILLVNIILELEPTSTFADLNQDGLIDVLDIIQLVNIILR